MTIDEKDFKRLWTFIRENYGVNLEKKKVLVEGRLGSIVQESEHGNFHDYIEAALRDRTGEMVQFILTRLTTNYSYFMREETHYQFMSSRALPEWTSALREKDLRTWSAGCSTGEEAYTAAMVILEFLGSAAANWDTTVLSTDISNRVLEHAKEGIYTASALDRLPAQWRQKYFQHLDNERYKVTPLLAKQLAIGTHNLMEPTYTKRFRRKFHIIFCRNVMIYFTPETKEEIINKFYDVLENGGYLFIGLSETLSGLNHRFEQVSPAIYLKR